MRLARSPRTPAAALIVCALLTACSSRSGEPYPTLEDYSDGTSRFAEELLAAWKSPKGTPPSALLDPALVWSGPLPGEDLATIASRPPMALAAYAPPTAGAAPPPRPASAELVRAFELLRSRFTR